MREQPAAGAAERLYGKLSPGPGKPATIVAAHQRMRIQGALVELAADGGCRTVTVRKLTRMAGVSTHTFYERFENKEECFLSTCELVIRRAARRIVASQRGARGWEDRVQLTFAALMREIASESKQARLALVEAFAAGPMALNSIRRTNAALEALAAHGLAGAPDGIELPPLIIKGIVAGIRRVACARLLANREGELPGLADELMDWSLSFRDQAATTLEPRGQRPRTGTPGTGFRRHSAEDAGEEPLEDERALIIHATTRLATSDGYEQLSVPGIGAAAGVPGKRVATHFGNVTDCFLAALELLIRRAVAHAVRQAATADTWPDSIHRAVVAFCAYLARNPRFGRLGFIELFIPGTPGVRFRTNLIGAIAERLCRSAPRRYRPSEVAAEASVGAALGIIQSQIANGHAGRLPQMAPTLSYMILAPAIGPTAAAEAVDRVR